jgi:hypothetical protein
MEDDDGCAVTDDGAGDLDVGDSNCPADDVHGGLLGSTTVARSVRP